MHDMTRASPDQFSGATYFFWDVLPDDGELISRADRVRILDVYFLGDEREAAMGGGGGPSALFCMLVNEPKRWVRAANGRIPRPKPLSNK
jgi:hypothetical protein